MQTISKKDYMRTIVQVTIITVILWLMVGVTSSSVFMFLAGLGNTLQIYIAIAWGGHLKPSIYGEEG